MEPVAIQPSSVPSFTPSDPLAPVATRVAEGAITLSKSNLMLNFILVGMAKERLYQSDLKKHANEAAKINATMKMLIDLNARLIVSDHDTNLTDEIRASFDELKKNGIELLHDGEMKISPERMAEIKTALGSHSDRLKMELQNLFTTKIQVKISEINSLLDILKTTEKTWSRLLEFIISMTTKQ
jgi:hypothetical protein